MLFRDVSAGEAWQPESASRYNAVNFLLRSGESESVTDTPLPANQADFVNNSHADIPAFSPVAVTGIFQDGGTLQPMARLSGRAVLCGMAAVDDTYPWGIALQDIPAGSCGTIALYGTAPALFSGSGRFASPSAAGLVAGENGSALIVAPPDGEYPGLVILGGASGAVETVAPDEYYGYFKLQLSGSNAVICNGYYPDTEYCGSTDVPGLGNIPRTELTLPENTAVCDIYLVFFFDRTERKYSASFMTYLPEDMVFFRLIGTINRGRVLQTYKNADRMMNFGNEWYLS
jgi:hypothetical protein